MNYFSKEDLQHLFKPAANSHKGQNGKLLIIGGSQLFHAASAWSLTVASKIVDLVLYSSTSDNNEAIVEAKKHFWDGIVVPRGKVSEYIEEVDCVLIGPGMPRDEGLLDGDENTKEVVNNLLGRFPEKKWVIDAGALQEVDPALLNDRHIITPHTGELKRLVEKLGGEFAISNYQFLNNEQSINDQMKERVEFLSLVSKRLHGVTILHKGVVDVVVKEDEVVAVEGGNEGLTKGGTGDVLAGLVAALYCNNNSLQAAAGASFIEKQTAEVLYESVGPYYNSSELAEKIPTVMNNLFL